MVWGGYVFCKIGPKIFCKGSVCVRKYRHKKIKDFIYWGLHSLGGCHIMRI